MSSAAKLAGVSAFGLIGTLLVSQAQAQSPGGGDAEITLLKQQLRLMEQKLEKLEKKTSANTAAAANANAKADASVKASAAYPIKGPVPSIDAVVHMPNNRPTICTVDEQNCVAITSRLHLDVGGYNYRPNTAATNPQGLDNGVNARRARIGVLGKFLGDWNYALVYDFGGSSDGFDSTASFGASTTTGGTGIGFLPGGGLSGIELAYLSYTGFKPFEGQLAIEGGYMDLPYTLGNATSSNDTLFMERAASTNIANNIAAGDFRSAFGARWFNDVFWAGAYVTGPTSGAIHSAFSTNPNGTSEQVGAVARAAGQVISGNNYSLHLGGDAEFLIKPPHNNITGTQTLALSDRPELRIDPTTLISTGAIANVSGAQVYSIEVAGTYGPFFAQGEYYWYNVERNANTGLPPFPAASNGKFQGGYVEASYVLTGETHTYNKATAAYNGIKPANPVSFAGGGWGAWEIAGRYSTVNLNDQLGLPTGVAGGQQTIYTLGLNWYVNNNIRFVFNYLHGNINEQASATNFSDRGSTFDAFAMRTQVAF
jgi:phosphate-selective porin OprO/OprP